MKNTTSQFFQGVCAKRMPLQDTIQSKSLALEFLWFFILNKDLLAFFKTQLLDSLITDLLISDSLFKKCFIS